MQRARILADIQLLTCVRFDHTSPTGGVYEGRAISLNMTFDTTFNWLSSADKDALHNGEVEMMWDVAVSQDDWVILGRKKGQYTAEVRHWSATDLGHWEARR